MNKSQEITFKELKKFKIGLKGINDLEKRKLQYDLMVLEEVLRAHVADDGKIIVIAKPNTQAKEIMGKIPKKFKPKVLSAASINYSELLKNTFNI